MEEVRIWRSHKHELPEEAQSNEFELLEKAGQQMPVSPRETRISSSKAVSKLSAIASLSAADAPKETEPLNEDDLLARVLGNTCASVRQGMVTLKLSSPCCPG